MLSSSSAAAALPPHHLHLVFLLLPLLFLLLPPDEADLERWTWPISLPCLLLLHFLLLLFAFSFFCCCSSSCIQTRQTVNAEHDLIVRVKLDGSLHCFLLLLSSAAEGGYAKMLLLLQHHHSDEADLDCGYDFWETGSPLFFLSLTDNSFSLCCCWCNPIVDFGDCWNHLIDSFDLLMADIDQKTTKRHKEKRDLVIHRFLLFFCTIVWILIFLQSLTRGQNEIVTSLPSPFPMWVHCETRTAKKQDIPHLWTINRKQSVN